MSSKGSSLPLSSLKHIFFSSYCLLDLVLRRLQCRLIGSKRCGTLYELDPLFHTAPRVIARNLGWLNGMDWGRDGFLYAPVWSKGQVVRIDPSSGEVEVVGDGFGRPAAVKFDSHGRLYLVDYLTGEVWQINT